MVDDARGQTLGASPLATVMVAQGSGGQTTSALALYLIQTRACLLDYIVHYQKNFVRSSFFRIVCMHFCLGLCDIQGKVEDKENTEFRMSLDFVVGKG